MAKPYSKDLRDRVLKAIDEGQKTSTISNVFKVCLKTIYNWKTLKNKTGTFEPKIGYQKGYGHKIKDLEVFTNHIEKNPNQNLGEIAESWGNVSRTTVHRALKKIKFTRKKNQLRLPGKKGGGKGGLPKSNS